MINLTAKPTFEEIQQAVLDGRDVYWDNLNYKVILNSAGDQFLVWSQMNDNYSGLTEDYTNKCFIC